MSDPIPNPLEQHTLDQLRRRTSVKWRLFDDDVIPLWVAEMDVTPAEPVVRALVEAVESGDTGYPFGPGYAEAFSAFASRRWGWDGVDPESATLVPDVMLGIVEVLRVITSPGDAVVVNSPVYTPFYAFVTHADRQVLEAPLGPDWRIDLEVLEEAFDRARAIGERPAYLLSNPHNPTGTVHSREELAAVAALARARGVRVVSDEIHSPLVLPGASFTPYLGIPGAEDGFTLTSASKAWNLAGLKAALAIAGPEAVADLRRIPEEVGHGPSHLGIMAHTVALEQGEPWLDALLAGLDANRTLLADLVAEHLPGVGYRPPEGTYLAWLDCRSLGLESEQRYDDIPIVSDLAGTAQFFLDRARVALNSGHVFGTGGAGHVRLNLATSQAILTEALTRMGKAVASR